MEYVTPNQITNTDIGPPAVWMNQSCMWTSIPKNGNMAYRRLCDRNNMNKVQYYDSMKTQYSVCVFRNPVHRLFSGLGEFKKRRGHKNKSVRELLEMLSVDAGLFDEHLEPQLVFAQGKIYTHILLFENLYNETKTVPTFLENEKFIDACIKQPTPNKSKYYGDDMDELYKLNESLVDDIINKYYTKDVLIWQNREKYIRKTISFDTV